MRGLVVLSILSVASCSSSPPSTSGSAVAKPLAQPPTLPAPASVFDANGVLDVRITMPSASWDALRTKGRDFSALAAECQSPPKKIYAYKKATVTINGTTLRDVGVRKKGFLGSLSVKRPSLKLKFDAFTKSQRFKGMRRLTLNNNKQDPSRMRTCLVYKVFRDAKLPAPRCNFARVHVNGTLLGIYSNVEAVKKPFLTRHFGDAKGELFEGQLADFARNWTGNFERKRITQPGPAAFKVISAVVAALALPDAKMLPAIKALVDYDRFLSFWALETITGHWDGYTNNRNNYFLYRPTNTGKLVFIPWGPDVGFTYRDPFHPRGRPASVSADAMLARRLYALPTVRRDYVARVRTLMASVWNEAALVAEVDRIDTLLRGASDDKGVAEIKQFITSRKAKLAKELAAGGGVWKAPQRSTPCWKQGATTAGTFKATFGRLDAINPMAEGKATLSLSLGGKKLAFTPLGVVAGRDRNVGLVPTIRFAGLSGGSIYLVQLMVEEPVFRSATSQAFHGFATWGVVFELVNMRELKLRGFLGNGRVRLDTVEARKGGTVSGSFTATVYEGPPPTLPAP